MGRTGIYEKLLRPTRGRQEANDQAQSDQSDQMTASLGLLVSGSAVTEERKEGNRWNLSEGDYGAARLEKPDGNINAVSGGARFTRASSFTASAMVSGVEFTDEDDASASFVISITGGATVLFNGCTFTRTTANTSHVMTESGSGAIFVGCVFKGPEATVVPGAPVIVNGGGVGSVWVVASFNYTGTLFAGVSTSGVIEP